MPEVLISVGMGLAMIVSWLLLTAILLLGAHHLGEAVR